jgi:peptidoglycan/LPS O-acetylase OafA/YrhL
VAVALVVVFHSGAAWFTGGFVGVDVFFVLSGYLVTNVMMNERERAGTLDLRRFYARRIRRLLPASVLMVVVVSAASVLVLSRLQRLALVDDARASLLYVANWHFVSDATDYFADSVEQSPFLHIWSLAIEEQFYVVFPVLLGFLVWWGQRIGRTAVVPIALAALASASLVAQLLVANTDPMMAYYGTHTRAYQLLLGALLAHALVSPAASRFTRRWSTGRRGDSITMAASAGLVLAASGLVDLSASTRGIVAAVLTLLVIVGVESSTTGRLVGLLSCGPMTSLGRVSYGIYLWHWPIVVLAAPFGDWTWWQILLLSGVGSVGLAYLSSTLLEMPVRRSSSADRRAGGVIAAGLAVSVVCAVVVTPWVLGVDRRPVEAARRDGLTIESPDIQQLLDAPAEDPTAAEIAATETPTDTHGLCSAERSDRCLLHAGGDVHVLVLGDSNAEQLLPALQSVAERLDLTLSAATWLGCPWQDGLLWVTQDPPLLDGCRSARSDWYDELIPALDPDLVIVSGVPRDPGTRQDGSLFVVDDPSLAELDLPGALRVASAATAERITANGARLVVLEPLPYPLFDPNACVSGAARLGECAWVPQQGPLPAEAASRAAQDGDPAVFSVDIDALVCPLVEVCLPVIDDQLVLRNQLHLSNAWLLDRSAALWAAIEASGATLGLD